MSRAIICRVCRTAMQYTKHDAVSVKRILLFPSFVSIFRVRSLEFKYIERAVIRIIQTSVCEQQCVFQFKGKEKCKQFLTVTSDESE